MPNANILIMRLALLLCAVALPIIAFNIFASSRQDELSGYWSLALTAIFTVFASAFVLWAAKSIVAQSTGRGLSKVARRGA